MDPLRCLRTFYTASRLDEVKLVDGRVSFGKGEYEFSGDVKTNFLSSINKQPYTLAQLLLYIQNWDKPHAEYAKLALKAHIQTVYTADKQKLRAYLKREQELDALDGAQHKRPLELEEGEETVFRKEAPKKFRRRDIEGNLRSRENLLVLSHKDFSNCIQVYAAAEKAYTSQSKIQQDSKAKNAANAKSSRMDRQSTQSTKQHQKLDIKIYGDPTAAKLSSQKQKPTQQPSARQPVSSKAQHGSSTLVRKEPPIIIVPESESAILSLFNVKELLQENEFVPMEQTAAMKAGEKKPDYVRIKRQMASGKTLKFDILDKVPRDKSKNWERVVAVVCSGKLWQFKKGFPFKGSEDGDLMETFTNLCGFYFHYSGDSVPETVKSWNVKCLPLNRSQRHGDVQTVKIFFDTITTFLDSKVRGRDGKYKKEQLCKPDKLAYK